MAWDAAAGSVCSDPGGYRAGPGSRRDVSHRSSWGDVGPSVGKPIPEYLRLHHEEPPAAPPAPLESLECLARLCEAFEQLTGFPLRYETAGEPRHDAAWTVPLEPGDGGAHGRLALGRAEGKSGRRQLDGAKRLAEPLAALLTELVRSEQALWRREAELAAGVPVVPRVDEVQHLAARLEAVLESGAKAVGFHAAALYLLDEATTSLKLRAVWRMPRRRLADPARPLRGAMADLEALLGHVVVLDNRQPVPGWQIPDDFPTAVCVPVSTPSIPLGTLWLYSRQRRELSDDEANVAEIVAGRLAADLEREMLLAEGQRSATAARSLEAAARWQQNQLPQVPPLVEGWDLAGWAAQRAPVGGSFYDWFPLPRGNVGVVVGEALSAGFEAALLAAQLRASLRSHAEHASQPVRLLDRVNHTIWTTSPGDQQAAMFYAAIEPQSGQVHFGAAGRMTALLLHGKDHEVLPAQSALIGVDPELRVTQHARRLTEGDVLVIASPAIVDAQDAEGRVLGTSGLADMLREHPQFAAAELAALVRRGLEDFAAESLGDRALLVVKHSPPRKSKRRPRHDSNR